MNTNVTRPLKKFGQNFLTNNNISQIIVDTLDIRSDDTIFEIGAGTGALTRYIIKQNFKKLYLYEIDKRLCKDLVDKFGDRCQIICKDFITSQFESVLDKGDSEVKIVGNIPYNLTTPIIFKILDNSEYINFAVIMMQSEVAERLLSEVNSKKYGILSVLLNAQARITKIIDVEKENFYPVPAVDSTALKIYFFRHRKEIKNYNIFIKIVHCAFNHRRKTLKNSLRSVLIREEIKRIKSVDINKRAENLSVNEYLNLASEIEKIRS